MKNLFPLYLIFLLLLLTGCEPKTREAIPPQTTVETQEDTPRQQEFAIAIHGGAGGMRPGQISDSLEAAYRQKLEEAVRVGHEILKNGGDAVAAVQASINILEDSPLFNAGKGAVLNHRGKPELDASIMEGKTLKAGAIAGVKHIKNPIDLAISVMNNSKHVLLAGEGAETFAEEQGFEMVPESYFITPERLEDINALHRRERSAKISYRDPILQVEKYGTVGCVALDKNGNLAAGTSTGGLTNKRFGRIGDSPIIGAGTYADNRTCAVSCTGQGEYYIRGAVAYDMSALMEYAGLSVSDATHKIIHEKQPALGGTGGIIAMDKYGNVSFDFNTTSMLRAKMDDQGNLQVGIFPGETD